MYKLEDFNVSAHFFTLSSGTNVCFFKKPHAPVYMTLSFSSGSRFDPSDKPGLAHFFEHMLLAGTKKYPSKDLLTAPMEDLGGFIGASTGKDMLSISLSLGDPSDFASAVELVAEVLKNSLFDSSTIENERRAILREYEANKANPKRWLHELTAELAFQGTVVSKSVLGTTESVKNITKEDIINYNTDFAISTKLAVTVCGDLEENYLKDTLETYLALPAGNRIEHPSNLPANRDKYIDYAFYNNNSLETSFSFRIPGIKHEDITSLSVLSGILGVGRSSVLKNRLRYEKGLVYQVNSGISLFVDGGIFNITAPVDPKDLQEMLDITCSELRRLAIAGPTQEELTLVKNRIIKSAKRYLETTSSWVDEHDYYNLYLPSDKWLVTDHYARVEKICIDDIKKVSSKYLNKNNWYLSMTGPMYDEVASKVTVDL